MYSRGRSVDSNLWSSVLVIFETFYFIRTENLMLCGGVGGGL